MGYVRKTLNPVKRLRAIRYRRKAIQATKRAYTFPEGSVEREVWLSENISWARRAREMLWGDMGI